MSWFPIALINPQYENFNNQWLKFYSPGTTNPLAMATDDTGATQLAKAQLNNAGFITTDGTTIFIPYVQVAYDAYMFPTEAEADANDTTNAIRFADNINPSGLSGTTTEDKTLISGQISVVFPSLDVNVAAFYLFSDDADQGRLYNPKDYSVTGSNTITLTNSYPESSIIRGIQDTPDSTEAVRVINEIETTALLIASSLTISSGDIYETTGFTTKGDGHGGKWLATGNTIAVSQSPGDLGSDKLSDANGNEFSLIIDGIINVNKLNSITAAISAVKALAGSLGDQIPTDNMATLYFPSGVHNKSGSLITISLGGTGFNVIGDGFSTNLSNIEIDTDGAARCSVRDFMMSGSLGHGVNSVSSGAFLSRQNSFSNLYIRDKTVGVIINGSTWNSWDNVWVEKSQGDGWQVLETNGEQVSNCYSVSNSGKGLYIEKGGEFKVGGLSSHNNVGYGVHLYGDDTNTVVENYFEGLTSTIQQRFRLLTITAIVTHADGIQVTAANHKLAANMDDINVTGTANYNGNHDVVTVIDANNFTLNVAYVANESAGQIDLPNWDIVIESDSSFSYRVNDQFFSGGNANYIDIIKGYNIRFDDMRIKKQIWVGTGSNLIFRKGSLRGRQQSPFNDVITSGDGLDGVFESVLSDNNGSSAAGTAVMKFTGGGNELNVGSEGTKATALYSGNTGTLSDDTVFSFTPPNDKGFIKVTNGLGQNSRIIDLSYDTVGGTTALAGFQGAAIDRANGVLTGTTGTDTKITVSAANDGKIYLENRNGSQKLWWTITR